MKKKKPQRKVKASPKRVKKPARRRLRAKPLKIKKSEKLPFRKNLNPGEYLEFRSTRGNIVHHPREDRQYYAYIRNKKSRKIVAVSNYYSRKTKEFIPRRFTRSYRKYISTPIVRPKIPRKPKSTNEFKLRSSRTIVSQIHKAARPAALLVYNEAKAEGFCVFRMKLHGPLGTPITRALNVRKGEKLFDIESMIAFSIIDSLRAGDMRMSSLELTDRPKASMVRSLLVELDILDVSKMEI